MTCQIAPSVISFPLSRLYDSVQQMADGGAKLIHFDVMDGQFVPPITFGDSFVSSLRSIDGLEFEAHLMVQTPEKQFEAFAAAGCSRIIFHAEATPHSHRLVQTLSNMGVKAGIAINPGTPVCMVEGVLDIVDTVLVMTVNPGWGGQTLIEGALDKVAALRRSHPHLNIEVDGGIDKQTLPMAKLAGANHFVVGSYLAKQIDLAGSLKDLINLCG